MAAAVSIAKSKEAAAEAEADTVFSYYLPVNIEFGCGKVDQAGSFAKPYGKNVLVVTGRSSAKKSGLYDRVAASLDAAGMTICSLTK